MRGYSLRRRLLALLLAVSSAAWLVSGTIGFLTAEHEADELLDAHLAQAAALLIAQAAQDLDEIDTEHAPVLHRRARKVAVQVWERGTRLRLHSPNAPDAPLSEVPEGFSDARHAGVPWRVFGVWDPKHETLVQVGELKEARAEIRNALGRSLLLPLLAGLPLLALAVWLSVASGLRPLGRLQDELARRDPSRLAPLGIANAPQEIVPLVAELNRLFARIGELVERERRFTADAAHELRTPLASIVAQAQVARAATQDAQRNAALDDLVQGAARATRLVAQLLTLARLDVLPQQPAARSDLRELVRGVIADHAPAILAKDLDVALEDAPGVQLEGHQELLAILARNLIDNALRFTPRGGHVTAAVTRGGNRASVRVANSGDPLAADVLARLGERFYRGSDPGEPGSGLGLSIVVRIAELHRGTVRFSPGVSGGGLTVDVELPVAER